MELLRLPNSGGGVVVSNNPQCMDTRYRTLNLQQRYLDQKLLVVDDLDFVISYVVSIGS